MEANRKWTGTLRVNARSRIADVGFHLLDSSYPLTSVPHPASVPDAILGKYPGVYRAEDGDRFELGIHGKRLVLYHVRSDFEFTLYPRSNTRFDALEIELGENASALFRTDVSGVVTRLDWTQQGRTVAYARERGPATIQLQRDSGEVLISVTGGADAGHHIEVSTDLRRWERIGTVQAGSDTLVDPGANSRDIRFYRAARIR